VLGQTWRVHPDRKRRAADVMQEEPRIATIEDLDGLTTTLSMAFRDDPVWGLWAFPEPSALEACWRFVIRTSLRYPTTWVVGDYAAAAVWIPPGGSDVPDDQLADYEGLIGELVGPRAAEVMELDERFEAVHPHDRPHYYLPLLGTHPDHRGRGLGMGLLAHNLAQFDAEGVPAYLESTNSANDRRYERLGFIKVGEVSTPDGKHSASTMWRDPAESLEVVEVSE
jgi:GNAT superfamily N-acetyltransferase